MNDSVPNAMRPKSRPNTERACAGLAALLLFASLGCVAGEQVYAYTDAGGELHLSNVPDDPRFRLLEPAAEPAEAAAQPLRADGAAPARQRPYQTLIEQAAQRYGMDAALLHAVISVESAYNAQAKSPRGAAGLMQLMPETARRYGVADVYDPAENVGAGARYLRDLLRLFENDLQLALAAYNAGEAAVIKYGRRIPPYRETVAYVPRVVGNYEKNRLSM